MAHDILKIRSKLIESFTKKAVYAFLYLYVLSTFWQQSPKSQEKYNSVDRVVCLTHRTKYISQAYFISILIPHKRLPSSTALFSSRLDNQLRFKLLRPTPFIECKVNCFFFVPLDLNLGLWCFKPSLSYLVILCNAKVNYKEGTWFMEWMARWRDGDVIILSCFFLVVFLGRCVLNWLYEVKADIGMTSKG